MTNTFDWIEIRTSDIEKSTQIYDALFGWHITGKVIPPITSQGSSCRANHARPAGIVFGLREEIHANL